jgi:hypothetical protein
MMTALTKNCLLLMFASLLVFAGCADEVDNSGTTTRGDTSGSSDASDTSGSTSGDTSGSTSGDTSGSTSGDTSGSTSGDTSGSTSGDTSGSTSGDTSGSTSGDTSGSTSGDTSGVTELCGNGRVDEGEDCDGLALNNRRCTDLNFRGGALACASDCSFNTDGCNNDNPNPGCTTGEFTCADGSCIPNDQLCNGSADCLRGEDEQSCSVRCQAGEFTCADDTCIPTAAICNGDADCAGGEDEDNCGTGTAPAGWTCSELWYGDGDCDCGCGVADSDCTAATSDVCDYCFACGGCDSVNATDNTQCDGGTSTAPAEWTCTPSYYDNADGCDCDCGAYDPDCDDATANVYGCGTGQTCSAAGLCEGGTPPVDPPAEWTCAASYYSAADGCDCNCGAFDPDCTDPAARVYGCATGQTCSTAGLCEGGTTPVDPPAEWTCSASFYGTADGCDCGCGAVDLDCDNATATACAYCSTCGGCDNVNATDNSQCDGGGTPTVPAEWTCTASFYDAADGCDCDCGAYDPDCADATATVYGCATGQTCSAAGLCEGTATPCAADEFTCADGSCIRADWECDSIDDCADASDEAPVNLTCGATTCAVDEFTCDNGDCIPDTWVCDTDNDCGDNSDEVNCP